MFDLNERNLPDSNNLTVKFNMANKNVEIFETVHYDCLFFLCKFKMADPKWWNAGVYEAIYIKTDIVGDSEW